MLGPLNQRSDSLRVIPDTNVILAASVNTYLEEGGVSVTHRFYGHALALFNQLAAHPNIGIKTSRIEQESYEKLQKAFEDTLEEQTGRRFWKSSSYGLNRCMDAMEMYLGMLTYHPVDEDDAWRVHRKEISRMYSGLWATISELFKTEDALVDGAPAGLRGVARQVYRRQARQHVAAAKRVERKYGSHDKDEQILADVLWIFRKLQGRDKDSRLIFSSCDTGFVSSKGNRIIPFKILTTFGVECEWPAVAASRIITSLSLP